MIVMSDGYTGVSCRYSISWTHRYTKWFMKSLRLLGNKNHVSCCSEFLLDESSLIHQEKNNLSTFHELHSVESNFNRRQSFPILHAAFIIFFRPIETQRRTWGGTRSWWFLQPEIGTRCCPRGPRVLMVHDCECSIIVNDFLFKFNYGRCSSTICASAWSELSPENRSIAWANCKV
jgi:hypothetical protein